MRRYVSFVLILILVLSNASNFAAQSRPPARGTGQPPIKLVVGIVIDQFRADYLVRFADQFVDGGFRRMLTTGANFANAAYPYVPTYTACGHAAFMGGASPSMNGIVGNEWWDRTANQRVTSVLDSGVKLLGGPADGSGGASPAKLVGDTLGDELRVATAGKAKVVGVSYKDRSAILPAGKRPTGAYWFDARTGTFVSSTYYFPQLPAWAQKFNRDLRPDRYFGKKWERLLPADAYSKSRPDDANEEPTAFGRTFPYTIDGGESTPGSRFYTRFEFTPFASEYLVDFAKAAIDGEGLGEDDTTDLLTISFSANDLIGHNYGPYSQEVQDITLRTDRILASLFDYLDKKFGVGRTLVALTADHGVAPIPEYVKEMGYGGRLANRAIPEAVEAELKAKIGEGPWVKQWVNGNLYFDNALAAKSKVSMAEVERIACATVLKTEGVGACITRDDLERRTYPDTPVGRSVARGFYPSRSGDVIIVPQPYFFFAEALGTTHGTPYSYDTHVPVIFMGAGVVKGTFYEDCSPLDIAPTLAAILQLTPPSNSEGRVLIHAIK